MTENIENSEVLAVTAETTEEIPDYSLPFTGDEVSAAIRKAHRMKMGKVSIKPPISSGGGTSVLNALSGFTDPVVFLTPENSGVAAYWKKGTASNNLVISIFPAGTSGLSTSTTYTVDYLIAEGG